ncbi:uncharacterized protein LODBEIA_P10660 [Lodderomyces beijingensis]|uniref:SWR1-complex protein 4 n=1 Tax=Lodderomyces beijingensis TaxID=1775926 RepID=A0ABP0ZKZ1_9ASCO
MSTEDILDVLNIQRNDTQPAKKKQKLASPAAVDASQKPLTGMARELYNLVGPNTPPISLIPASHGKDRKSFKPSPWTKLHFTPKHDGPEFLHWVKGSESLLTSEEEMSKPYYFEKFDVHVDIPALPDKETYEELMKPQGQDSDEVKKEAETKRKENDDDDGDKKKDAKDESVDAGTKNDASRKEKPNGESDSASTLAPTSAKMTPEWSYEETKQLFDLCRTFELKWPVIQDRFPQRRTTEEMKRHFYHICSKILQDQQSNTHDSLIDALNSYSKEKEVDRKQYLENLLLRTPAEIAEEESLVIEARRFELAAKKMLTERSNLLALLDSPQSAHNVAQYQSSQGITNLYNNLMLFDKHQKKKMQQQKITTQDPVPPPIPPAASSSIRRDRVFQTQLQQYLSSLLKQNYHTTSAVKQEANAIHELLMKKLTQKEEEAYGLHYHGTEKLTPGVSLRSQQKMSGLQQKQSVLKSVSALLQELDIPTAGGSAMKPIMPTRKTMAKYDELLRAVVTLLEVKKARDKLESEIALIKSQRDLV